MIEKNLNCNYLIIVFSKDLYKFHYALTMASSLKAIEKQVTIFITGYACNFIRKDWEKYDNKNLNNKLKKKKIASVNDLLSYCNDLKIKFYYCTTAMDFLEVETLSINNLLNISPIGLYSILNLHREDKIIFI